MTDAIVPSAAAGTYFPGAKLDAADKADGATTFDGGVPGVKLDLFSSTMARLLSVWIVLVAVLSFVTVPWLKQGANGDLTQSMTWFYHALMLPAAVVPDPLHTCLCDAYLGPLPGVP